MDRQSAGPHGGPGIDADRTDAPAHEALEIGFGSG
jgi:hypothetical protein